MSDEDASKQLGRTLVGVELRRCKLGIPIHEPKHRFWSDREDAMQGRLPDWKAAERMNRSLSFVAHRRRRMGLPAKLNPSGRTE